MRNLEVFSKLMNKVWENSFKKIFIDEKFNKKQLKFHELSLKNMVFHFNFFYTQNDTKSGSKLLDIVTSEF